MAKRNGYNLVAYDGAKAVTIMGDEGWEIRSGGDKERPDSEVFYAGRVPIVFRGMELRADAVASIPFDVVEIASGETVDSSDAWTNFLGFLPEPELMFWLIESAWTVNGKAYLYQSKNRGGYVKILRYMAPGSVNYDSQNNDFVRSTSANIGAISRRYPGAVDQAGNINTAQETMVYLWKPDPDVEYGVPLKWPAKAALEAMGVLYNLDEAAKGFFKRGMLHTYMFRVPAGTQQSDKDKLQDQIKNFLTGIRNAWGILFLNADAVESVDLGGGLDQLSNIPLTMEKREDVAIAMGIPQSKFFSTHAGGLGGKGVVDADDMRLILDMAIPEWHKIARILNKQVFGPLGYRIEEQHKRMNIFQEDETRRADSLGKYTDAFLKDPEMASLMAEQLGIVLNDDVQAKIDMLIKERKTAPATPVIITTPPTPLLPAPADTPVPDGTALKMAEDYERYKRKALKHIGEAVPFESNNIPADTMLRIDGALKACKTADDVRELFSSHSHKASGTSDILRLASAIESAVKVAME